jgi:hypothetical protein
LPYALSYYCKVCSIHNIQSYLDDLGVGFTCVHLAWFSRAMGANFSWGPTILTLLSKHHYAASSCSACSIYCHHASCTINVCHNLDNLIHTPANRCRSPDSSPGLPCALFLLAIDLTSRAKGLRFSSGYIPNWIVSVIAILAYDSGLPMSPAAEFTIRPPSNATGLAKYV